MTSFDPRFVALGHLIPPQAWNGGADLTSAILDTSGYESVGVSVHVGATTDNTEIVITFHEGDASDFTPDSDNKLASDNVIESPTMDGTEDATYLHAVKTNKRYLAVIISRSGTSAAALGAQAILGHPNSMPT